MQDIPDFDPSEVMQRDADWLRARRRQLKNARGEHRARVLAGFGRRLEASAARVAARRAAAPRPDYDPALPITARREDIIEAIRWHPVVVIAGETGSGKSTQIPKLCLEAGRGVRGLIGCTQPRRIAARSVATRVARELGREIGEAVGYQVRFTERVSEQTLIKFMTDGILLAEIHGDRRLDRYDTLIIDEAHERSLNVDFLLGYLKRVLARRRDLRVVITSATIDTEKFSRHFDDAPVIEVSGRGYPVEVIYQPPPEDQADLNTAITGAVATVSRIDPRGDILVFLPGEADILAAARHLRRRNLPHTEILPLYARLPAGAQDRIFATGTGRRIVLATNVAETSLTVPGIRFVIDSGLARISRYATHSKVLRLPVEPISRASADQRKGRCGRIGPGVCVRLYSEADYLARPEFTEPEILRTPLASTLLRLLALGLGEAEDFPFVDPPPPRRLKEARQTLFELGAVDTDAGLTDAGRQLAALPLDVRQGRMLLAGAEHGALAETLTLVAAMAIPDPRERPPERQQAADQAHAAFRVPESDFLSLLQLWSAWHAARRELSGRGRREWAQAHFLSPARLREWEDLRRQLQALARAGKLSINRAPASGDAVHRALLAGLIAHVGHHQGEGEYQGARGHRFRIFPGSVLARRQPAWIMAAELVETARPYARTVAPIAPEWLEAQAPHLIRRTHIDPHWHARSGRVMAYEQVSLFGLVLVEKRRVHFGPHDPALARRLFIRHALVRGEMDMNADFIRRNALLRRELAEAEHKRRRHDVLAAESALEEFFDHRLPPDICTVKAFGRWLSRQDEEAQARLLYNRAVLLRPDADQAAAADFPDTLQLDGEQYELVYRFEPGHVADGVTLRCPLHLLNRLDPAALEWLVPGLLPEKVAALIGSLPKPLRRSLVPAADYARAALERMDSAGTREVSLVAALARTLSAISGLGISPADFAPASLPPHLHLRLEVHDGERVLAAGRDPRAVQRQLEGAAREAFMRAQQSELRRDGLTDWPDIDLPPTVLTAGGHRAWPALVDQDDAVGLRVFDQPARATEAHRAGLARLLRLRLHDKFRYLEKHTGLDIKVGLAWSPLAPVEQLAAELRAACLASFLEDSDAVRDRRAWDDLLRMVRGQLLADYRALAETASGVVLVWRELRGRIRRLPDAQSAARADALSQLDDLIYAGFAADVAPSRLAHYPRYLQALNHRLDRLQQDPARDARAQALVHPWWQRYLQHLDTHGWYGDALDSYRWLVEEYRVQCFAQPLGTAEKVSPRRLEQAWAVVEKDTDTG